MGWTVVAEHEADELAKNPDDKHRLENTEKAAERKMLARKRKLDAAAEQKRVVPGLEERISIFGNGASSEDASGSTWTRSTRLDRVAQVDWKLTGGVQPLLTYLQLVLMSNLEDPELRRLAEALPDTILRGKADNTTKKYLSAFIDDGNNELRQGRRVPSFPAQETHVVLYLQPLRESVESKSAIKEEVNALSWLHQVAGLQPVSSALLVQAALAGFRRMLAQLKVRKEPVTADFAEGRGGRCRT
eukprot:Em0004g1063a